MDLGDLKVRISADLANLSAGLQKAQAEVQAAGKKMQAAGAGMQSVGRSMSLAVTAPIALMAKMGIDELKDIEQANGQTAAAIARIGKGSLVSVGGVQKLAGELQRATGIDDQMIQSAQNAILTLGGLNTKTREGANTFNMASRTAVNMAEALGMDVVGAGKQVAKSMAAASQGVLLLPRGMKLSKVETDRLEKAMGGASSAGERQALVMDALGKKFAGAAKLTSADKWAIAKDQLAGISATLVGALMPSLLKVTDWVGKMAARFEELSPKAQKMIAVGLAVAAALGPLLIIAGSLTSAIGTLMIAVTAISAPLLLWVAAAAAVGVALVLLWRNSEAFRDGVTSAFESLQAGVSSVLGSLRQTIEVWTDWARTIWSEYGEQIKTIAAAAWGYIRQYIGGVLKAMRGVIQTALAVLRGDWSGAWNGIKTILSGVWQAMSALIGSYLSVIKAVVTGAWNFLKAVTERAWGGVKDAAINAVKAIGSGLKGAASAIPGKLDDAFDGAVKMAARIGDKIKDAVLDAVRAIPNAIRSISLPSIDIQTKNFAIPGGPSITVPSGVSWNAAGGIFNGAQIIGVGEAGPEALVPLGSSRKAQSDRARVMEEAGLSGGSGVTNNFYIQSLSGNDPAIQRAMSRASNGGFGQGAYASRLQSGRRRIA